jgi:phosphatidylethanolamine/phosphatidyl-N-methylethanolamine N-methyltransferase
VDERRYWEQHAKNYERSMSVLGKPLPRTLELVARTVAGAANVLEVAAGTGLITTAIAPQVGRLVATDFAEAMVTELRRRVQRQGLMNVECESADIYDLRYPDRSFDAVVAANVLHLVPDLPRALSALRRVLRPGGKLIAPTFCHDETRLSRIASRIIGLTGFPGHRRFTTFTLRAALREAGLAVEDVETVSGVFPIAFMTGRFG